MLGEQALIAAMGALFAVQLFALYAFRRTRHRAVSDGGGSTGDPETDVDEDGVECPHCGARNELGYRFCGRCVGELPDGMTFSGGSGTPFSRRTM